MNKIVPTITVYGDDKGELISKFLKGGHDPLVDTINGGNYVFLNSNYVGPHRFYVLKDGDLLEFKDPEVEPDFCIAFNIDEEVDEEAWRKIYTWLEKILVLDEEMDIEMLGTPVHQQYGGMEEVSKEEKTEYEFQFQVVQDNVFYEVWKPNTDRPYTVVVENFSLVGHTQFFSSLFVCDSWGVGKDDFTFLKMVWDHLEMKGVYDLEKMVKEHVEECKNGKPEPRVYRKRLQDVVKMFTEIGSKRKFQNDERRPKMLVLK
jgi:hypothetical protein